MDVLVNVHKVQHVSIKDKWHGCTLMNTHLILAHIESSARVFIAMANLAHENGMVLARALPVGILQRSLAERRKVVALYFEKKLFVTMVLLVLQKQIHLVSSSELT